MKYNAIMQTLMYTNHQFNMKVSWVSATTKNYYTSNVKYGILLRPLHHKHNQSNKLRVSLRLTYQPATLEGILGVSSEGL